MPASVSSVADPFVVLSEPSGLEIHLASTRKYKSVFFEWVAEAPLDEGSSARALLADVLTRATRRHPDMAAFAARCEELFAADVFGTVAGIGDRQLLRYGVHTLDDRHAGGAALLEETTALLAEVLHDPPLVEERFREDHVEQERANLVRAIASLSDDKAMQAYRRLVETMHAGTPYARHAWGTQDEARRLGPSDVHAAWTHLRTANPVRLFVIGDVTEEGARRMAQTLGQGTAFPAPAAAAPPPAAPKREVGHVTEREPLAQSKLALGFRVDPRTARTGAAQVFAQVFGGDSHSRLFKRVREKESLAYGCSASLDPFSATLVVQTGIDAPNAGKVEAMVQEELTRLGESSLDEDELDLSRKARRRRLQGLHDAPAALCRFRHSALIGGRRHRIDEALAEVDEIGRDDVAGIADGARLDTVYFLEGTAT